MSWWTVQRGFPMFRKNGKVFLRSFFFICSYEFFLRVLCFIILRLYSLHYVLMETASLIWIAVAICKTLAPYFCHANALFDNRISFEILVFSRYIGHFKMGLMVDLSSRAASRLLENWFVKKTTKIVQKILISLHILIYKNCSKSNTII